MFEIMRKISSLKNRESERSFQSIILGYDISMRSYHDFYMLEIRNLSKYLNTLRFYWVVKSKNLESETYCIRNPDINLNKIESKAIENNQDYDDTELLLLIGKKATDENILSVFKEEDRFTIKQIILNLEI